MNTNIGKADYKSVGYSRQIQAKTQYSSKK